MASASETEAKEIFLWAVCLSVHLFMFKMFLKGDIRNHLADRSPSGPISWWDVGGHLDLGNLNKF